MWSNFANVTRKQFCPLPFLMICLFISCLCVIAFFLILFCVNYSNTFFFEGSSKDLDEALFQSFLVIFSLQFLVIVFYKYISTLPCSLLVKWSCCYFLQLYILCLVYFILIAMKAGMKCGTLKCISLWCLIWVFVSFMIGLC